MKQIIILFSIIFFSATAFSQKKDTLQLTDSTSLLQWRDFLELDKQLIELPAKYANPISAWLQERFRQRAAEWQAKNSKKEQPKNK